MILAITGAMIFGLLLGAWAYAVQLRVRYHVPPDRRLVDYLDDRLA